MDRGMKLQAKTDHEYFQPEKIYKKVLFHRLLSEPTWPRIVY